MSYSDISFGQRGTHNELVAMVWLMQQGYEVFRNSSPHGSVDVIGLKNGQVELFDIKKASYRHDGAIARPKFTQSQKSLGVKCICVFEDGTCTFDERERFEGDIVERECMGCGGKFILARGQKRTFCSPRCSLAARKAKKRSAEAETPELI